MNSLVVKFASGFARFLPTGNKAGDPLANIKSATRWLGKLPVGDTYKSQQAISRQIQRFNEETTHYTAERFAILCLLDERSIHLQDALINQYLRNPRMSRLVENQLWHAIYGFYWELAQAHHTFVQHLVCKGSKHPPEAGGALSALRAIELYGQVLKWRAIRYLPPSDHVWLRLHTLYLTSEKHGFHRHKQVVSHENEPRSISCESAYLHGLMLSLANTGSLYPRQLDQLDHWLDGWQDLVHFDTQLDDTTHIFAIDLSADHGPRRVRKPDLSRPLRFWATADLLGKLTTLKAELQQGRSPLQLDLPGSARSAEVIELFDHLLHQWSSLSDREQRRSVRTAAKRLVDVTHGLTALIRQLEPGRAPADNVSTYGAGLNYDEEDDMHVYGFVTDRTRKKLAETHEPPAVARSAHIERWVMHDDSACGYGAIVESRDKDWLRVGALLGIRPHNTQVWKVGIVRRISGIDSDTSSVGIETLPSAPVLCTLYDTPAPLPGYTVSGDAHTDSDLSRPAVWLANHTKCGCVILDSAHFSPGKACTMQVASERKTIRLGDPIDRNEGWICLSIDSR